MTDPECRTTSPVHLETLMNVRTRATIEIARSPEEVFDFVADPAHFARWLRDLAPIPGVKAAEPIPSVAPLRDGTRPAAESDLEAAPRSGPHTVTSLRSSSGEGVQRVGSRRRIEMTDGAILIEEVLVLDRPHRHAYRWEKPKLPFSLLVQSGRGDWTFARAGRGTRVEWTYTFELTSPLAYLPGRLVVLAFNRWMRKNLARIEPELAAARGAS